MSLCQFSSVLILNNSAFIYYLHPPKMLWGLELFWLSSPRKAAQSLHMRLWSTRLAWNTTHTFPLQWWFKRRLLPRAHSNVFSQLFPQILHCSLLWGHNGHCLCMHSDMRSSAGVFFFCCCCGHMRHLFLHLCGVGPSPCTKKSCYFLTAGYAGVTGFADMIILPEIVVSIKMAVKNK